MATSTDAKIIDRESSKTSLADRYKAGQPAGGAYQPVQKNVKTTGANELSLGGSTYDTSYTVSKGFVLGVTPGTENFNQKSLNYSDTINGGVKTDGVNKISTNWNGQSSVKDALYTVDPGFRLKATVGSTQFKDAIGNQSRQLSLYLKGFNSNKYINGSFTR
jgi:hypothetical protein